MKKNSSPLILDLKGNSLDDGPGIRSVVFFKGCPLSCVWCHNPESQKTSPEISFDPKLCVGCETCLQVCKEDALSRQKAGYIDRNRCTLCFDCITTCPSGALDAVGKSMHVDEIVEFINRDKPFFDASGGGVTLSGGEPAMFPEFAGQVLAACKAEGIQTLVETCGQFALSDFVRFMLPCIDSIFFDIKLFTSKDHKKYCGVTNENILHNFVELQKLTKNSGQSLLPRIPLIPDITATKANISAIADFLTDCSATQVSLLSYNPLWIEKCAKIGTINSYAEIPAMQKWLPNGLLEEFSDIFHKRGIDTL